VQWVHWASHLQQKLSALVHGMGISHLPTYVATSYVEQGQLIAINTQTPAVPSPFFMAWKKKARESQ
jgi:DNA-binding transcriptional LysR family regulator